MNFHDLALLLYKESHIIYSDIEGIAELINYSFDYLPEKTRINIQTNGFDTKRMEEVLNKLETPKRIRVCLSLDGVPETHEKIRRIPNGYEKIMNTQRLLKEKGIHHYFSFTLQPENQGDILKIYNGYMILIQVYLDII